MDPALLESIARAETLSLWLLIFLIGVAVGGAGTAAWLHHRYRTRPLLLIAPGQADMPMADAVRHVRRHGDVALQSTAEAARALLDEAASGRLSLWRPSSPLLFRRLTPRQVRRARAVLGIHRADEIPDVRFVRDEVERRWPGAAPPILPQSLIVQKSDDTPSYVSMCR